MPPFHSKPRLWLAGLREEFNEAKDWLARIPAMLLEPGAMDSTCLRPLIRHQADIGCRFLDAESELSG